MLIVRLLRSHFFFFLSLSAVFFSLSLGLEVGRSSALPDFHLEGPIKPALFCPDGTSIRKHAHHLKGMATQALFELGDLGRVALRDCLCQEFGSGKCAALKLEIIDRIE